MLKENIQLLEESTTNMKELENENALLREKIENLFSSSVSIYISWFICFYFNLYL